MPSIYFEVPFCDLVTIAVGLLEKVLDGSGGWGVTGEWGVGRSWDPTTPFEKLPVIFEELPIGSTF